MGAVMAGAGAVAAGLGAAATAAPLSPLPYFFLLFLHLASMSGSSHLMVILPSCLFFKNKTL
jgi:hypothetical protein